MISEFARSRRIGSLLAVVGIVFAVAYAGLADANEVQSESATHKIFVMSNGWHSNVIVRRRDIAPGRIPEIADFPGAEYLEFGWGDSEYYPAKHTTFGMTLRAAFTSTPAVMHVVGSFRDPTRRYPTAEVIELSITSNGLERLVHYIHQAFERGQATRANVSHMGLYTNSLFYPATGRFHLGNTCNTWTAEALDAAGFDVDSAAAAPASDLMLQLRQLAKKP